MLFKKYSSTRKASVPQTRLVLDNIPRLKYIYLKCTKIFYKLSYDTFIQFQIEQSTGN